MWKIDKIVKIEKKIVICPKKIHAPKNVIF